MIAVIFDLKGRVPRVSGTRSRDAAASRGGENMKTQQIVIVVLVAVVTAAGGFYGGMQYQKSQRPSLSGGQFFTRGNFQGRQGNFQGARPVTGEIIGQDDKSITVKMQDGSSKIVILSAQTVINKAATGTKSDLKTGERIAAFGTENSDGSVTAQTVQLNPMIRTIQPSGTPGAQ